MLATYLAAVAAAEKLGGVGRSLVPDFVLPLVPIAAAYIFAHYFTLFLIQGQFIITLISDPFGRGWDLFGTVDFAPNLATVTPEDDVVRAGRRARRRPRRGLAIAHDRAVAVFQERRAALEAQLPMLGLMVLYTRRRNVAAHAWLVGTGASPARSSRCRSRLRWSACSCGRGSVSDDGATNPA